MSDEYLKLRSPQIAEAIHRDCPIMICLGAVEQHGDHLPVGTDTIQVEGLARKAKTILRDRGVDMVLGPTIAFGPRQFLCEAPHDHVGSVFLSNGLLQALIKEISLELIRHGFQRLYLLIGNAESDAPAQIAAKELCEQSDAVVTTVNWPMVSGRLNKGSAVFPSAQGHGGAGETSRMMVLQPDSVDLPRGRVFYPREYESSYEGAGLPYIGGAVGRHKLPSDSFSEEFVGIIGAPEESSVEAGTRLIETIGTWIADVVASEEAIWKGQLR